MWLISFLSFILGSIVTVIVMWFIDAFKCRHEWEKIVDTSGSGGRGRVVVHMCKKCGKRKITKV